MSKYSKILLNYTMKKPMTVEKEKRIGKCTKNSFEEFRPRLFCSSENVDVCPLIPESLLRHWQRAKIFYDI